MKTLKIAAVIAALAFGGWLFYEPPETPYQACKRGFDNAVAENEARLNRLGIKPMPPGFYDKGLRETCDWLRRVGP